MEAYGVENISQVRNEHIESKKHDYEHLKGLWFSDVCRNEGVLLIEVLIGSDYIWSFQEDRVMKGEPGEPVAAYIKLVKPYNTKITITPEEVKVGTSVNITCYSEGRPEPRYNITHNRIVLSTGKTYTISKAKLSDAGTYECIAWNKLGRDSASANLTVEVKPENTKITITQEGVLDSPVTMTCSSEGRPEPSYTITHNGTVLLAGRMYTIPKVKWSNAGTYKCIAENKLGRDS
ncbi:B-cell receptor CD22-like, partial [Paramuricea clavata]